MTAELDLVVRGEKQIRLTKLASSNQFYSCTFSCAEGLVCWYLTQISGHLFKFIVLSFWVKPGLSLSTCPPIAPD